MIEKTIYRLIIADKKGLKKGNKNEDISFLDFIVLNRIAQEEEISQFVLAKETEVARSIMVSVINKLVSGGYIRKEKAVDDKRVNILKLTEEGQKVWQRYTDNQKDAIDYILHDITLNEEKAILKFLAKASQRININE